MSAITLASDAGVAVHDPSALLGLTQRIRESLYLVPDPEKRIGVALSRPPDSEILAILPPCYPEWLGDRGFQEAHGCRFAYIVGEMARGIASAEMVVAAVQAGLVGFFGSAGLSPAKVEEGVVKIRQALGDGPRAWGANLIHSPNEPELERVIATLLFRHGVRLVSASAFMALTPAVVWLAAKGLAREPASGAVLRATRIFAKVSRAEVAAQFMNPPPQSMLAALVQSGDLTSQEANLAGALPVAEDITVEADSGGHTDNRPLVVLLPSIQALRDESVARIGRNIRIGAAGGLGTPAAVAAAFAMGASYVLVGSVNQTAIESGQPRSVRRMLADVESTDVAMAPSADMFERGVRVQVTKRGTLFPFRAHLLYDLYSRHASLAAIPPPERARLERDIFRQPIESVWNDTRRFFESRDAAEIERAERDPKHKMALVFRWYLAQTSRWPLQDDHTRRTDFQIWCGPAMGAFNAWAKGTFLEPIENRSVEQIALNLLEGAAVIARAQQLRSYGVAVPPAAFTWIPRRLTANGSLLVDGLRIYEVKRLTAELVPGSGCSLCLERQAWLGDYRPTYTVPVVPMTVVVEMIAATVPGATAVKDVQVQRWIVVSGDGLQITTRMDGGTVALVVGNEVIATGRTCIAPPRPETWPSLEDAKPVACPYATGELFHGPAFQVLRDLHRSAEGGWAWLDATKAAGVPGDWSPALLDGGFHVIPLDNPAKWWGKQAEGAKAFPQRVAQLSLHGPVPRAGLIRVEARARDLDAQGKALAQVQWLVEGIVWAQMDVVMVLLPAGRLGAAPALSRRAFLRDRRFVEDVSVSREINGRTSLPAKDVANFNWLRDTFEQVYGVTGTADTMAREIAVKEHAARRLGVHPSSISEKDGWATSQQAPLATLRLTVAKTADGWTVTDDIPHALALDRIRRFWRERLHYDDNWPVEDLFVSLADRHLRRVCIEAPEELEHLRRRGALFLANHQVAIESPLFSYVVSALCGRPIIGLAKAEHRNSWIGRLVSLCAEYPGVKLPNLIMLFDRSDPASMLGLAGQIGELVGNQDMSLLVHVEGTRSVSCRTPVTRLSSVFLDLATTLDVPIVPVRFAGALPVAAFSNRFEFPIDYCKQDIYIGRPIYPGALKGMALAERKEHVLSVLNSLGPSPSDEIPNPGDRKLATKVDDLVRRSDMEPARAAVLATLVDQLPTTSPFGQFVATLAKHRHVCAETSWLTRLAEWFFDKVEDTAWHVE